MTQVPAPSAAAWLIDLTEVRGPAFVVLRPTDVEALDTLVAHLVEIGAVRDHAEAHELVDAASTESVGVVW